MIENGSIAANLLFGIPREIRSSEAITNNTPTIYTRYYQKQLKELSDNNLIILECDGYLDGYDVNDLDLRTPIFIQSRFGSSYFKILEITYRNADTPSSFKLQKIII